MVRMGGSGYMGRERRRGERRRNDDRRAGIRWEPGKEDRRTRGSDRRRDGVWESRR